MKKVALISDGWKRNIIYAWADGIMIKINEYAEEVTLHHYNCYGNWSSDELHNQGEYNIFNLPDLSQYDGIIFDGNNINDEKVFNYVTGLIRKSNVPAVSISIDIDGFYYAGIDNSKPIKDLLNHMYDIHSCRSFVFAGGPKDNYENESRVGAYIEFVDKMGLSREDNPVYYLDYDFASGERFFKEYVQSGKTIPDVVVCACDNIAAGVCTQAEKMGYVVPRDFKVTGFDNLDKAAYFTPQITTVDHHNRGEISGRCMEVLFDIWEGKQPRKYNYTDTKCIFAESCGCENNGSVDYRQYMKEQIIYGVKQATQDERISELESAMAKCNEFVGLYACMNEFFSEYECEGFFVIIDKLFIEGEKRNKFKTVGYNKENLKVVYACDKGINLKFSSVDEMNSYIEESGARNEYLFTPIHFRQYTIGYTIIKNAKFLYDNPSFYNLHNILVKDMESLYDHVKLSAVNKKLKDIYNKDQLTGIYNRVAYAELIAPEFQKYYEKGVVCAIAFIDVDKFKQINDTYGHEYGDEVLKKVARIIDSNCPRGGYACRYGGDEFIMFFPDATGESAKLVKENINEAAEEINIQLSIGIVLSSDDYGSNINNYFEVADKLMYEEKMLHKMGGN